MRLAALAWCGFGVYSRFECQGRAVPHGVRRELPDQRAYDTSAHQDATVTRDDMDFGVRTRKKTGETLDQST
jgi:hypothetical protein